MRVSAIIAGGGSGKRMLSGENKLFIEISGTPVLAMTISAFESTDLIDEIIIVMPSDEIDRTRDLVKKYSFKKVSGIIPGGPTRQDSVFNGIQAVLPDADIIAIHDGARPFVTKEIIVRTVNEAKMSGAAVAAVPVKDTIKTVDAGSIITGTLDREMLWQAQTPQAFSAALIKGAHGRAHKVGLSATDDSRLVERLGENVKVVNGSYENIKITTPEDIKIAEVILRSRK